MTWHSYHGSHAETVVDGQPCVRFTPSSAGHSRHVTRRVFVPPVRVAGWARMLEHTGRHTGNHQGRLDGLHVHVGHCSNSRNYIFSAVMRGGESRLMREYGWRGYDRLATGTSDLQWGRGYVFTVDWHVDRIETTVADETATRTLNADIPLIAGTPADSPGAHVPRIPAGSVGFRLDNVIADAWMEVRAL